MHTKSALDNVECTYTIHKGGDMETFLCLVIDKESGKELAEYRPDAADDYFAQRIATRMFENDQKYRPNLRKHKNWYVDSCRLS